MIYLFLFYIICLFVIYLFASHADGNTLYIIGDDIDQVVSTLKDAVATLFEWF